MKMKVDLLQLRPHIVFQVFVSHLSLEHEAAGEQGKHFIIIAADASHLHLLFRQVESALTLVRPLLKPEKPEMLPTDHESFCPVAQTTARFFDLLHYHTLVIHYQGGTVSEDRDMGGRTEIVMREQCVSLRQICQRSVVVLLDHKRFLFYVLLQLEHLERPLAQDTHHRVL